MNFFKALIPGTALNLVVAGIIGSNRSKGAWLAIQQVTVQDHHFYWSWPLFGAGTFMAWVLYSITPR